MQKDVVMSNAVQGVIFDMDNTLLATDKLAEIREQGLYRNMTEEQLKLAVVYKKTEVVLSKLREMKIPLAIVTNSPKDYASQLLDFHNLAQYFPVVISYGDVGAAGAKPSPKGIQMALKQMGLCASDNILYIGDDHRDFNACYAAGIKPIAPAWGSNKKMTQMPAAVLSSESFISELDDYDQIKLIAERCAHEKSFGIEKKQLYFAPLNLEGNIVALDRDEIDVACLGRYYSQGSVLMAGLHDAHSLSKEIVRKDHVKNYVMPEYFVDLLGHVVKELPKYLFNDELGFDIISVVPAKYGKNQRLENLLGRIGKKADISSTFIKDLFYFSEGAKSLKTLGAKENRVEEINKNLKIKNKYKDLIEGKKILIIDDVLTTGATLQGTHSILTELKAERVFSIALAKTVSFSGELKICPECSSTMNIRKPKGVRFWGCSGYFTEVKCTYTEEIKIRDCPDCQKPMYKKQNRRDQSYFVACSGYPKCRRTDSI